MAFFEFKEWNLLNSKIHPAHPETLNNTCISSGKAINSNKIEKEQSSPAFYQTLIITKQATVSALTSALQT